MMKSGILLFVFACCLSSIFAQNITSSWEKMDLPTDQSPTDIVFINADTGFIICEGDVLLKTIDGGDTWMQKENIPLKSLKFTDNKLGYGFGNDNILMTTDYGETWNEIDVPESDPLKDLSFINEHVGYVGVGSDILLKTVDGGKNWQDFDFYFSDYPMEPVSIGDVETVNVINDTIILVSGSTLDWVFQTRSSSFYRVINDTVIEYVGGEMYVTFTDVHVVDGDFAYAVGSRVEEFTNDPDGAAAYLIEENGTSWKGLDISHPNRYWALSGISMLDKSTGFVNGRIFQYSQESYNGALVYYTTDGISWNQQYLPRTLMLGNVVQTDTHTAYAISGSDVIRTSTGAKSIKLELPDEIQLTCHQEYIIHPQVDVTEINDLTYNWDPITNLSDPNIAEPIIVGEEIEYILTVSEGNLSIADTVRISILQSEPPAISHVTVDETEKLNKVVLGFSEGMPAETFIVFKETSSTDVFEEIGRIQSNEELFFIDSVSNASQRSSKYKITMIDSCGIETNMSQHHTSIHLSVNADQTGDCDLAWNAYEGFDVLKYRLWRGTQEGDLELLDSISGTSTSYTDQSTPEGALYYRVEALSMDSEFLVSSISNLADNGFATLSETDFSSRIFFHPNPTKDFLKVSSDLREPVEIEIYDLFGKNVMHQTICGNQILDLRPLVEGIYIIKLSTGTQMDKRRIIKL